MRGSLSRPQVLASGHDVELAAFAASGDRAAFGELVRRHGSVVRGLLRRMGASPAVADGVARDAFIAAFEQISEFRGEGAFQAWVRRIAAKLYIKRHGRDARLEAPLASPATADGAMAADPIGAPADLDLALEALSAAERLCVSACYGAGLSLAEVAEALNAPLSVVKANARSGLDKLRSQLEVPVQADAAARRADG